MNEVEQICDRVGIIRRGVLVAEGTIAELRDRDGLRVRAEPLDAAYRLLATLPEIDEVAIDRGGLRIAADPAAAPAIARALVGAGINLHELAVERATLEEVFLELTQTHAHESEEAA
jgi:ABC-2 type transport system ATP-binding protein